jgi:hypothetical protein
MQIHQPTPSFSGILPIAALLALAAPQAQAAPPTDTDPAPIKPVDWRDHPASEHLNPAIGNVPTEAPSDSTQPSPIVEPEPDYEPRELGLASPPPETNQSTIEPIAKPQPPPPVIHQPTPPPTADHPRALKLGALGLTGVATLVGGVASAGAGALLMSLPSLSWDVNPRNVGTVILIGGGVAAALGIAAVVDTTILERRRQQRRVHVGVDLSTTQAGLSMSGSF